MHSSKLLTESFLFGGVPINGACCCCRFLQVHILPREVFGKSTFAVAMRLLKTFPMWFTDSLLVWYTWALMGDTSSYGFHRPAVGPMALKGKSGKTPVLDVGTFARIKNGDIKV
jgi:indole-3-pyruvate monooxygenase